MTLYYLHIHFAELNAAVIFSFDLLFYSKNVYYFLIKDLIRAII